MRRGQGGNTGASHVTPRAHQPNQIASCKCAYGIVLKNTIQTQQMSQLGASVVLQLGDIRCSRRARWWDIQWHCVLGVQELTLKGPPGHEPL